MKSAGPVGWFLATFPYILMTALLIGSVTLPGASKGILYYMKLDFARLLDPVVWIDANFQVFMSYGLTLGSQEKDTMKILTSEGCIDCLYVA